LDVVRFSPARRPRLQRDGAALRGSKGEAEAYVAHDVLGPRLIECTRLVMAASEKPINAILGSPDDIKFRSSMTLFDAVSKHEIFAEAIGTFYSKGRDPATLDLLRRLGT
jgi:uncharacterized protein (DUF1810 family)